MTVQTQGMAPPRVRLVGKFNHSDFEDVVALLSASAQIVTSSDVSADLTVVAQGRPGLLPDAAIRTLRCEAPLSGIVALLGTWCEGETRTGRPWSSVARLYWYEFPAWWRRQLAHRAAGRCPDWARWGNCGLRIADCRSTISSIGNRELEVRNQTRGLIVLSATVRETAAALADALRQAGYATLWQPPARPVAVVRGAVAGIWDGGQLSEREEEKLAAFRRAMSRDAAPVIALLDFPRRDRCHRAQELGAAAVLGKPWLIADLVATIEDCTQADESSMTRAA